MRCGSNDLEVKGVEKLVRSGNDVAALRVRATVCHHCGERYLSEDAIRALELGRGLRKDRKLPLRALREATDKTQDEIARLAGMDQSEISRVEQRDDLRLSTLRRYARALDAEIEIIALLPTGHRIKLDL